MPFLQVINEYFQLKNDLLVVLDSLDTAVQEGVARMEKMHGEMITQNGR